tara:strand:- start:2662 stop:4098 length:1437 start_codon:yes stop_codon:yes gene_type:complete
MNFEINNICCIGAGYVGGPTMAVIADNCPDIQIEVVDVSQERINNWNSQDLDLLPIYEPGLSEIIERCRGKNLHFSTLVKEKIYAADLIFISVNTPTKKKGIGAGKASDLKWVEACARQVAEYAQGHTIVVEKSTLPVRTAETIMSILKASKNSTCQKKHVSTFDVLSNPEFLSEGTAINDLENPDRVLIGGENYEAIEALCKIYQKWVPENKILRTNIWSSELAKLTANAFLAQRISSINSISALCEETGADIREVSRAIGSDTRIGSKFLDSGPGFGGSCFKKDILNLVYLAEHFGLPEVASFWNEVVTINTWHQHRISRLIIKKLFGTLSEKKIAILGFAFKGNTNDTRESAAIQICKDLLEEGAEIVIHDPKVKPNQIKIDLNLPPRSKILGNSNHKSNNDGGWDFAYSIKSSLKDADAVLILTEWSEYLTIEWQEMYKIMRKPAWIFDSRSIIDPKEIKTTGLNLWRVGDGTL